MELLAPAGNIRSFHAAISAGANAVYLGVGDFNARMRADNFTVKTLSHLIPFAHSRRVKVYVAINTMVRQNELAPLADTLYQLSQIGVDALIVADIGVIRIARRYFPSLALHGSTQMYMHNSECVGLGKRLGLRRVILPRELTLTEIAEVRKRSDIELEVFVHGALCYSFSGVCLASSFLGGGSGNRGRCTQVCRRRFTRSEEDKTYDGAYFSPNDLSAIEYVKRLKEAGVISLKIEGRMRSAEYVHTVVSAYRQAIDAPARTESATEALKFDMGRRKTTLFLSGVKQGGVIAGGGFGGTGVFAGTIIERDPPNISLDNRVELHPGDQIRIHPQSGFEGVTCKIKTIDVRDGVQYAGIDATDNFNPGDAVYLISRKSMRDAITEPSSLSTKPASFKQSCPFTFKITGDRTPRRSGTPPEELLIKIDSPQWLPLLKDTTRGNVMAVWEPARWQTLLKKSGEFARWRERLVPALPVFIPQDDLGSWHGTIDRLAGEGITRFACSHAGLRSFFPKTARVMADTFIWSLNRHTQEALHELGFREFAYSVEDDFPNIRSQSSEHGYVYIYSRVPLFISRIKPAVKDDVILSDPHENRFLTRSQNNVHYLLAQPPMCLFNKIDKLKESGIARFIIDLSFMPPDEAALKHILESYKSRTRIEKSSQFNFKLGLK